MYDWISSELYDESKTRQKARGITAVHEIKENKTEDTKRCLSNESGVCELFTQRHQIAGHNIDNMAEDIAREIIAQSRGGSKLALSFKGGDVLLYTSRDSKKNIVYHVHKRRDVDTDMNSSMRMRRALFR